MNEWEKLIPEGERENLLEAFRQFLVLVDMIGAESVLALLNRTVESIKLEEIKTDEYKIYEE